MAVDAALGSCCPNASVACGADWAAANPGRRCTLYDIPTVYVGSIASPYLGPMEVAGSLAGAFLLQALNRGMPPPAWGKLSLDEVVALSALHGAVLSAGEAAWGTFRRAILVFCGLRLRWLARSLAFFGLVGHLLTLFQLPRLPACSSSPSRVSSLCAQTSTAASAPIPGRPPPSAPASWPTLPGRCFRPGGAWQCPA